jgi:hypothetical protein
MKRKNVVTYILTGFLLLTSAAVMATFCIGRGYATGELYGQSWQWGGIVSWWADGDCCEQESRGPALVQSRTCWSTWGCSDGSYYITANEAKVAAGCSGGLR